MSNRSWIVSLKQAIRQTNKPLPGIAVVGIGHELRGDDAAGIMVARKLRVVSRANWLVLDAGPAPENFTGKLRDFAPDLLLLVDAVQINEPPGTIRLLEINAIEPYSMTTHSLSPHLLIAHLQLELNCIVRVLGIQVEQVSIGSGLSPAVQASIKQIVQAFAGNDKYHA